MKLKDIGVTPLIEMSAAGSTSAGSVASVMAPLGKMITRRKRKKDKNPSIYGGPAEENVLFAEVSARPEYHNTQVKGSDATPKAKPGRTKHPFKGKLVGEGDMEADREAGIKWVDDPDWEQLHNMDLDMVKDFLDHKGNVSESVMQKRHLEVLADIIGSFPGSTTVRLDFMNHAIKEMPKYNNQFNPKIFSTRVTSAISAANKQGPSEDEDTNPVDPSYNDESIRIERKLSGAEKKRKNIT